MARMNRLMIGCAAVALMASPTLAAAQAAEDPKVPDQGASEAGDEAAPTATQDDETQGTEIIVTAQKRAERLIDTPLSVTVLGSEDLFERGATQFRDFAGTVPALSYTNDGGARQRVSLRGVTVGADLSATVGIYVDDVSQTSSGPFSGAGNLPFDVGLFDVDRIEVLRGPQGTLYGASALGGVIRYVTRRPDPNTFSGEVRAGISATRHGGIGYNAAGVINVPIVADRVALRASAFENHDGGYIDNVFLDDRNVNKGDVYGGRLDLLVQATDDLSIRLVGFAQEVSRDGKATADYTAAGAPQFGSLGQSRRIREFIDQRYRLFSATIEYDLGFGTLSSINSYQYTRNDALSDFSPQFLPVLTRCPGLCRDYSAVGARTPFTSRRLTSETRLVSNPGKTFDWLAGIYFTKDRTITDQFLVLYDPDGDEAPNDIFTFYSPSRYREIAGFGNLTWHVTDKFSVTGGLRHSKSRQGFEQIGSGVFGSSVPPRRSRETSTTYLANAKYEFSPNATAYLRYATGFQPGGPNALSIDPNTGQPFGDPTFGSSKLKSYEAGLKAQTPDKVVAVDIAAYRIDWTGIQLTVNRGGFNTIINAPDGAVIDGGELTLTARPTEGLVITGALAALHARFSEDNADLKVKKGDRLPTVPNLTASVTADYTFPVSSLRPTVGATFRHVEDRTAAIGPTAYRLPAYRAVDLRAGVDLGRVDLNMFVNNLFDKRGQISQLTFGGAPRIALIPPRTIGLNARMGF